VGAGVYPNYIAVGDVNRDGKADLVVAAATGPSPVTFSLGGSVAVLLSNGDGTFGAPQNFPLAIAAVFVAVADFNLDGSLDIAVALTNDNAAGDAIAILPGNGKGSFGAAILFAAGQLPNSLAVGDFNGDGKPDLAVADSGGFNFGAQNGVAGLTILTNLTP
jgi:hypothetical protein